MIFRLTLPPRPRPVLPDLAPAREAVAVVLALFGPWGQWVWRVLALMDGRGGRNVRRFVGRAEVCARTAVIEAAQTLLDQDPAAAGPPPQPPRPRTEPAAKSPPPTALPPGAGMRFVRSNLARGVGRPSVLRRRGGGRVTAASLARRMDRIDALLRLDEPALAACVRRAARALAKSRWRAEEAARTRSDGEGRDAASPDRGQKGPAAPRRRRPCRPAVADPRAGPRIRAL